MSPSYLLPLYPLPGLVVSRPMAQAVRTRFVCPSCSTGARDRCSRHLTEVWGTGIPQAILAVVFVLVAWPLALYLCWLFVPEVRPSRIKQLRRRAALERLRDENDELARDLRRNGAL